MHGGDIYSKKIKMDFSVNVNPLPLPSAAKKAYCRTVKKLQNYPDINCRKLREKLSEVTGIAFEKLIAGNGASELISAIVRALKPGKTMLLAPSFTGYSQALSAFPQPEYFYLKKENNFCLTAEELVRLKNKITESGTDFLIITNPNNPNGKLMEDDILQELAVFCREKQLYLLLDETFKSLTDNPSVFFPSGFPNLILVRAFTKSFALAGLRLGWAAADLSVTQRIKKELPEWNVSLPAQETGLALLKQGKKTEAYLEKSRRLIKKERLYLSENLIKAGFQVFPSDSNFILFYSAGQSGGENLFLKLYEKDKILIRDCSDYIGLEKGYFRIAVKNHRENKKLIKKIMAEVEHED